MLDYNIISTGSRGNATVINAAIMIDCGVPFKALGGIYKNLRLVLLTHRHGDHFNCVTIKTLARTRPTLRFGCPAWLAWDVLECGVDKCNIDPYTPDTYYKYGDIALEPFYLPHDVPNTGYKLEIAGKRVIYATDTNDMSHVNAPNFDLYLIEANHTEDDIRKRIQAKTEAGEYIYEYAAMQNHLSKEKCDAWLLKNMGESSEFVYMHEHNRG